MIYADIDHFRGMFCNCEPVVRAIKFLAEKAAGLEDGRHQLGDGVYVDMKHYSPAPAEKRRYESHIKVIDIQVALEGAEIIYCQPMFPGWAVSEDRLAKDDVRFHVEPPLGAEVPLRLGPGVFAMLMPNDVHKTECFAGYANARKAIAKVPVDLVKF